MLEDQKAKLELADAAMIASLAQTAWFGKQIESALESGDLQAFGSLLDQYWQVKRARTRGMSNDEIDQVYQLALANGAIGGKIVGAGAGGFLLLITLDPLSTRNALKDTSFREVPFNFSTSGVELLARG
jgi:D-glycero-alpha-D-manno-heptose-7-phosphate kinase